MGMFHALTVTDIVLIVLLILFAWGGWRRGFVMTLAQVIGSVIGFVAAKNWSPWLGRWMAYFLPKYPGFDQFVAYLLLFLVVAQLAVFVLTLVAKALKIVTSLPIINFVNRTLGAVLGVLEGILVLGTAIYIILTLNLDKTLVAALAASRVAVIHQQIFRALLHFAL